MPRSLPLTVLSAAGLLLAVSNDRVSTRSVLFGQSGMERLNPGTLLVASEKLGDPNFAETVVYLTRRDTDGGTIGLILNRPLDITLAKAFPKLHTNADPVYEGGPVSADTVEGLLRTQQKPDTADHVAGNIYLVTRKVLLEKSLTERLPGAKFRVYLGYAGWGPNQLENEVRQGAWTTLTGANYVFDSEPASLWQRLNRESQSQVARAGIERKAGATQLAAGQQLNGLR